MITFIGFCALIRPSSSEFSSTAFVCMSSIFSITASTGNQVVAPRELRAVAGVVEHADALLPAEFRTERADRLHHLVFAGVELEIDLEAQLLQFARDALRVVAGILERRFDVFGIADHQRHARQRI